MSASNPSPMSPSLPETGNPTTSQTALTWRKIASIGLTALLGCLLVISSAGCHRKSPTKAPNGAGSNPAGSNTTGQEPAVTPIPGQISIAAMNRRVPVIMFHDVLPAGSPGMVWFDDTIDQFTAQMEFIKNNGLVPISIQQLYDHLENGTDVPANAICLTFDDNYLGFYTNAYPILKQYGYPSAVFVHTNFVGDKTGDHPKMSWDQLQELIKGGLVTIGAHTESHPLDMTVLTDHQQTTEIAGSKQILEKHLGVPIDFIAWPNGKYNGTSIAIAKQAGFKMAFAMDHGFAEESPGMYQIHRWSWEKMQEAVQTRDQLVTDVPAAIDRIKWTVKPVQLHVDTVDGLKIAWITGGSPETMLSDMREGVIDFVKDAGAAAGVNGGFFAMSSLYSTSNVMIGPCYTNDRKLFTSGAAAGPLDRLRNRPVIMWSDKECAIFPFQPDTLDNEAVYRAFIPDMTNLFIAGAWMIHNGVPMTDEQMLQFDSKDIDDPRRRAFFGWMPDGQPVAGASLQTCSTERLAEVAAKAGVQDAVLLDSGFSTSLVFNGKIVVTGHTAKDLPSRPVPHAIVLMGTPDLANIDELMKSAAIGAIDPSDVVGARRGKIRTRRQSSLVPIGGEPRSVSGAGPAAGGKSGANGTDDIDVKVVPGGKNPGGNKPGETNGEGKAGSKSEGGSGKASGSEGKKGSEGKSGGESGTGHDDGSLGGLGGGGTTGGSHSSGGSGSTAGP